MANYEPTGLPGYIKATGSGTNADPYLLSVSVGGGAAGAGDTYIGSVGGKLTRVAVEMTRPADTTAYTVGDVVSNNATTTTPMEYANLLRVAGGSGYVVGCLISTNLKSIVPALRVHLFNAANPTVAADNAAFKELYADAAKRCSYFDMPAMTTATDTSNSDMSRAVKMDLRVPVVGGATASLWVVLEALTAFTPASGQLIRVVLIVDNN